MKVYSQIIEELRIEASAILRVAEQLDPASVNEAFDIIFHCKGKVVVTGIGKTGIIARKISATLASTGTSSIFLHAAEGLHGDLGMIEPGDVTIAVSNSGNSQEIISLIPYIKYHRIPLIAITGSTSSSLANNADVVLNCYVPSDLEPLGLVPTSSTTVALALGDALAIALLREKNFQLQDYALFHPGGAIGKKLLLKVSDLMHQGQALPIINSDALMSEVIMEMTSKKLGCSAIVDATGKLAGMVTDGDLRRQLQVKGKDLLVYRAVDCMTSNPRCIKQEELAVTALNLMEDFHITMLPVVDDDQVPVGMLHMHDLIRAGLL